MDGLPFQVMEPAAVAEIKSIIDRMRPALPGSIAHDFDQFFGKLVATIDSAVPPLFENLQDGLTIQFEVHTERQKQVLDFARTLDSKAAEAIDKHLDSYIEERVRATFLSFGVDERIEDMMAWFRDHLDVACEEYAEKTKDINNTLQQAEDRLKLLSGNLRTETSDFVLDTSSSFKDLVAKVEALDKDVKDLRSTAQKQDDAIKEINRKLDVQAGIVRTTGQGLVKTSTRSKENRVALLGVIEALTSAPGDIKTQLNKSDPCRLIIQQAVDDHAAKKPAEAETSS